MVEKKKEEEFVLEGFEDMETDPELDVNGSWRKMNDGSGREFLVAYAENPRYQAKLMKLLKPQMVRIKQNDEGAFKLRDHLSGLAMIGTVLLDWRGGSLPKFEQESAAKILTDRRFRKFRNMIQEWSEDEDSLLEGAKAEAVKN